MRRAALALALTLVPARAGAVRPTEGGLWAYADTDVLAFVDLAGVRVHYSVEGPNQVKAGDADADGVPDFAAMVADTAVAVLGLYADELGFRPPVPEAELGLEDLGGSPAFDVYLVDFGGAADGAFGVDACQDGGCAGHFVMENDFTGYGYPSVAVAVDTVVSHELFHAVQAAYASEPPSWFAEGSAVWAERAFRPASLDFLRFCDAYLADVGRSLFKPPAGPVPSFAYGTGLWWDFLVGRHGPAVMEALLLASAGPDLPDGMAAAIAAQGDDLEAAWTDFVAWNLATGSRAGALDGHPYAAELDGVEAEQAGAQIDDDERVFSLAAAYYRVDHPGGPLWFGLAEPAPAARFALHAVAGGAADGPVEAAALQWDGSAAGGRELGELAAGGYWISASHPAVSAESARVHLCTAARAEDLSCVETVEEPTGTGGEETSGTSEGPDSSEGGDETSESSGEGTDAAGETPDEGGCGCRQVDPPSPLWAALLLALPRRRRARA